MWLGVLGRVEWRIESGSCAAARQVRKRGSCRIASALDGEKQRVGRLAPRQPAVAQCARAAPARTGDVARHAQAEHVLGVAGHARSIAVPPDRIDVVDVGELPVAQAARAAPPARRSRCRSPRRPRAAQVSTSGSSARVLRAGHALPEARRRRRARAAAPRAAGVWITTSTDSGILNRRAAALPLTPPAAWVLRRRMCSSRSCFSSTGPGALVSRSCARCVFGKAITSRSDSAPVISITKRSRPMAMPPCGGAPYCSASSRKPNLSLRLLGVDLERAEHLALHLLAVDPDRAAAELDAVEHHVVGLGDAAARDRSRASPRGRPWAR